MDEKSLIAGVLGFLKFGLSPNKPVRAAEDRLESNDRYKLLIVEFDDQGMCFGRPAIVGSLAALVSGYQAERQKPVVIVFVHGWKHSARADDCNLRQFRELLSHTASANDADRPVLGVYLAWRGLSRYGNWFWLQSSFWSRQKAAQRIAQGTPREILGLLKAFRNGQPGQAPQATLVIVGHSFGGLIVYTAIAQSLIEAAASQKRATPSFGDLVLLVNPAFSAVSYMPIWSIVRSKPFDPAQLPVCVSVTALNDWATGWVYPLGTFLRRFNERCSDEKERQALTHTMGHLAWMRTHELALADKADSVAAAQADNAGEISRRRAAAHQALLEVARGQSQTFGGVRVGVVPCVAPSPFWVASATKDIIDGHNGIFKPSFIAFVRGLIGAHLREAAAKLDGQASTPAALQASMPPAVSPETGGTPA
jgi:pimeloyl-ACP methyl ester carboxylesterase